MAFEFRLPDIGEGVVEGEIVRWLVKVGEEVREDQPLVEVMTDKATVEISSPKAGRVLEARGGEGDIIKVHSVLVVLDVGGGSQIAPAAEAPPSPPVLVSAAAPGVSGAVGGPAPAATSRPVSPPSPASLAASTSGKVLATPATRAAARDLGVDLGKVPGSGDGGRVLKTDVLAFAAAGGPSSAPAPLPPSASSSRPLALAAADERVPIRGLRKRIYDAMVASKTTIPHFCYVDEVDMSALSALREQWKGPAEKKGVKITYLPFVMKALQAAFLDFPTLNAWVDDASAEMVLKKSIHLGVSTDTPNGLYVAVVREIEHKSILEVARDLQAVVARVRDGKGTREDLSGSTFTITSVGNFGGMFATPIINKPEVAILGLNRIHERPVVREGQIVIRPMMYVSSSFDHRVIDGAVAARFTNRMKELLENPQQLFLEMR